MSLDEAKELDLQARCFAERLPGYTHNRKKFRVQRHVHAHTHARLSGLTLESLHVHRDLTIDIAAAVDEFSGHHSRQLRM